jgi:phage shock protein PspC (stress-responsive transcriptional regulator)
MRWRPGHTPSQPGSSTRLTDSETLGLVLVGRSPAAASAVEGITMHNAVPVPPSAPPASSPPSRRHASAGTLLTLVNGVLAGVGSVYVGTHSVLITVIAVVMAIVLAVMVLIFQR